MPKAAVQSPPVSPKTATDRADPPAPAAEKPIHRIQIGIVRGSIWKSRSYEKPAFTLTLDRVVTDKARNEQITQVFESTDVRNLTKVTKECAEWIEWQKRYLAERAQPQR